MIWKTLLTTVLITATITIPKATARRAKEVNATIKFDNISYTLTLLTESFVYRDELQRINIKESPCNRVILLSFVNQYHMFRGRYLSYRAKNRSTLNVILISETGHRYRIERNSAFGVWLRDMPKKMRELQAQAKAACAASA
jgi:hypothetical protein